MEIGRAADLRAGARQPDDAAHTAIMVQIPTERPMNAGDKPSQASWRRAPREYQNTENATKQGGLTDSCSEPKNARQPMFLICLTDQARHLSTAAERKPAGSETAAAARKARAV